MTSILNTILSAIFILFGISLILSILNYAIFIRPVALRNRKRKSTLSKFLWFSGEELSDYWDVERIANETNNSELKVRTKTFKYCMYSTVLFFVLGFIFFFINLIWSLTHGN